MSHYTMLYKYGRQTRDILGFFVLSLVYFSIFWGAFLIKQLFHSRLLDMRLVIANSCPTRVHGTIVKYYIILVYTTQVNSTFRARWLASSEVISQVLFTSEQPKKNKMAFVAIFSQINLLFGQQVIQLVWYILQQLFTSVSVKVVDIYLYFGE